MQQPSNGPFAHRGRLWAVAALLAGTGLAIVLVAGKLGRPQTTPGPGSSSIPSERPAPKPAPAPPTLLQQADAAEKARQWALTADLLTQLIRRQPDKATFYYRRGNAHAALGQWDRAIADLEHAVHGKPDVPWYRHRLALVLVARGDDQAYREACGEMSLRFADSEDPETANAVLWVCALLPDAVADYAPLIQLGERAVQAKPEVPGYHEDLGAVLFRAGQFERAAKELEHAIQLHGQDGWVETQLFLAMSCQRLGRGDEARKWLAKAIDNIEEEKSPSWQSRTWWQRLRPEAEGLIRR